jgi:hypothetical protein
LLDAYGTNFEWSTNQSIGEGDIDMARDEDGPLDGSTTGTIGGGGRETGGSTDRPKPPEITPTRPEHAASGRRAPDPLAGTTTPDDLKPGRTDVSRK